MATTSIPSYTNPANGYKTAAPSQPAIMPPVSGGRYLAGTGGTGTTTTGTSGGGSSTGAGSSGASGGYSAGQQPGGNNYPQGIYGVGGSGSGTAVGTITPDELTSQQLNGLLASNSPYIQQARQSAINQANSRGLLNSSIAAGNSQAAAIQAGLPIAQSDAQAAYGLQQTNLNNLAKIQSGNIAADAQVQSAQIGASASMYGQDQATLRQREDLAYQGEQAGLNYQRNLGLANQNFYNQSALSAQNYQQNLGLDQFNLGSTLLSGMQNFSYSAGLNAMNNPAIMGDPQSFGGYMQFISNVFGGNGMIDNIFNSLFGQYNPTSQPQQVGG